MLRLTPGASARSPLTVPCTGPPGDDIGIRRGGTMVTLLEARRTTGTPWT